MISIKKIDTNNLNDFIIYDKISIILEDQCDSNSKEYFAVIDGKEILGHALVTLFQDSSTAEVIELYIVPQQRNQGLGDGLLRTVFNYLRNNFFTLVIIKNHKDLESFLIKEGMKEIDSRILSDQIKRILNKGYLGKYYICSIDEFFKRKCKGSQ